MRRRVACSLVAVALGAGATAAAGTPADAAPTPVAGPSAAGLVSIARQSPAVVREAREAMARFRELRATRTPAALRAYWQARNEAATATAVALGVRSTSVVDAWASADRPHQVALLAALTQLGVEYRYASSRPGVGFDCSGLTLYAWRQGGRTLYPISSYQIDRAIPRTQATAHAGDLVYYPGHVMLYIGVGRAIVHASNPQDDVELEILPGSRTLRWGEPRE